MSTSKQSKKRGTQRRRFEPAFKREAVELGKRIGVSRAAADLGITESNLRNWSKAVATQGSQAFLPVSDRTDVEAENRRLREEVRVLKMERDILKSNGVLRKGRRMRYEFIAAHCHCWPVTILCRVLCVTTTGYSAWKKRPASRRVEEDDKLAHVVRTTFEAHHGNYGVPRITAEMRGIGYRVNRKRVARLMREMGLHGRHKRRFKPQTTVSDPNGPVFDDLLKQDFSAEKPNQKWVGDITYLETTDGFEYLATVLDLHSRRIVGWALGSSIDAGLVCDALRMTVRQRRPVAVIFHSDRGCQYTSAAFRALCHDLQVRQSMSRTGCCYDNAVAESFFHSLKVEWLHGRELSDRATVRNRVFEYIESYYNRQRRHSTIDYLSPIQFEDVQASRQNALPRSAAQRAPDQTPRSTSHADGPRRHRNAAIRPPAGRSVPAPPGCLLPAGTSALYHQASPSGKQP